MISTALICIGDTVAYALVRGRLESATAMVSFLVTPLVAGLSDAIGRRLPTRALLSFCITIFCPSN
jgi:hypothetical protein